MNLLPLNALRAFAIVYETGGIRPAAREMKIAHSSVSRHVRELEEWLGTDLLDKSGPSRTLSFTANGETLGKAGLKSFRDLETAITSVRERRRGNSVQITTPPSVAVRWLLPRLQHFNEAYPWIELSVVADQRLSFPGDRSADIGIRMGTGPWDNVDCGPLMGDLLFPVMSPRLWERCGRPDSLADLAGLTLLHDRDPSTSWERWCKATGLKGVDTMAGPRFASSDLVLRAAAQGLGVTLARGRLAEEDLTLGTLIRPFADASVELPNAYWIVREEGRTPGIATSRTLDWLKQQAEKPLHLLPPPDGDGTSPSLPT